MTPEVRRVAILDLDGPLVDASARFAEAEKAGPVGSQAYWRRAFTADLLDLDCETAVDLHDPNDPGKTYSNTVVQELTAEGWQVVYLSSREDTLLPATWLWLYGNSFPLWPIILRPQFVKTAEWKAAWVEKLAHGFAPGGIVAVVDDEMEKYGPLMRDRLDRSGYGGDVFLLNDLTEMWAIRGQQPVRRTVDPVVEAREGERMSFPSEQETGESVCCPVGNCFFRADESGMCPKHAFLTGAYARKDSFPAPQPPITLHGNRCRVHVIFDDDEEDTE